MDGLAPAYNAVLGWPTSSLASARALANLAPQEALQKRSACLHEKDLGAFVVFEPKSPEAGSVVGRDCFLIALESD